MRQLIHPPKWPFYLGLSLLVSIGSPIALNQLQVSEAANKRNRYSPYPPYNRPVRFPRPYNFNRRKTRPPNLFWRGVFTWRNALNQPKNVWFSGSYRNGRRHGKWLIEYQRVTRKRLFARHYMRARGSYQNGHKTGTWWYWSGKQAVNPKQPFVRKPKGVRWKRLRQETFRNKKLHGKARDYYQGKLTLERHYRKGIHHGRYRGYAANGKLTLLAHYKMGRLHGKYKAWDIKGRPTLEQTYKKGILEGPYKTWHPYSGRPPQKSLKAKGSYHLGLKHGTWQHWSRLSGNLIRQENFKRSQLHGQVIYWHTSGKKIRVAHYRHNKRHGKEQTWYPSGKKKALIHFRKGMPHGTSTHWYQNGQKSYQVQQAMGKNQGSFIQWFPNGQKALLRRYVKGQQSGKTYRWYANGQKALEENFIAGLREGKASYWHPNGKKSRAGIYRKNQMEGNWKFLNKAGKLFKEAIYRSGRIIRAKIHTQAYHP